MRYRSRKTKVPATTPVTVDPVPKGISSYTGDDPEESPNTRLPCEPGKKTGSLLTKHRKHRSLPQSRSGQGRAATGRSMHPHDLVPLTCRPSSTLSYTPGSTPLAPRTGRERSRTTVPCPSSPFAPSGSGPRPSPTRAQVRPGSRPQPRRRCGFESNEDGRGDD